MILLSFSYKTNGWELKEMSALQMTNLLVGKNASGKSRVIKALLNVTNFIQLKSTPFGVNSFKAKLVFNYSNNEDSQIEYEFELHNGVIVSERLISNGENVIKRDNKNSYLFGDEINPPSSKLVVQVRRDKSLYPQIEEIVEWAEGVTVICCSDINPFTLIIGSSKFINPLDFDELVGQMTKEDKNNVIGNAKNLGYDITNISLIKANPDLRIVTVKERYIKDAILSFNLSSGMMRVLYLLCFLEFAKHKKHNSLLLIDDLGEGLDYSRAIHLGRMVFDTCEETGLQLIASSNDSFLMDVVDLSKWQILRRKYSKLSVVNQVCQPELFAQFRMTGLSNFDFFSSDFIDNFFEQSEK